jgi:hypothetical protein
MCCLDMVVMIRVSPGRAQFSELSQDHIDTITQTSLLGPNLALGIVYMRCAETFNVLLLKDRRKRAKA